MTKKIKAPKDIRDIFGLLSDLRNLKIHFSIHQYRPDSIMVFFTLVGCRVEVDFFIYHIEFSHFDGNEDVHVDWTIMQGLLDKHWSDD